MSDAIPPYVTRDQMRAAAEALGLDPGTVTHFQVDATSGVIVVTFERTPDGKLVGAPSYGAVSSAHYIPIGYDQPGTEALDRIVSQDPTR
jgi:hypothetical protein